MAGMLPGVECARRRRCHQGGGLIDSHTVLEHCRTRRSSFCLYTSNHETHHLNSSSSLRRYATSNQTFQDEKLGGAAREAKERLDERLRTLRKPEIKSHSSKESLRCENPGGVVCPVTVGDLQREVFGSKTSSSSSSSSSSRRFSWAKMGWKASDQDECTVCLERFMAGESLVHLPCAHRFHSRCLAPWLQSNAHCPCCRMGI
ncbi:hypothetical protein HHK36_013869 [Tetracentron sinense]|uniref:RING-type domain-containing protein n=1 Tax=Tetracentron sinense TaxID=13715 RepID=A0A834Z6Y3_TETSI|nr:hypothetical protein HHK36_013869 [Tetracentron sinense]